MTHPARPRRQARGNALVEFVLVLPLLLVIVLGALDWGWYFTVREVVVNATRQGARVGSVAPAGSATADAQAAVRAYLLGSLGATYVQTPTVTVATNGAGYQTVTVALTAFPTVPSRPTSSLTGYIALTKAPATITAQTVMRLEP